MKRISLLLMFLLVGVVIGAKTFSEMPMAGLYESIVGSGYFNGEPSFTPWTRIGVNVDELKVYYMWDSNSDGRFDDEGIKTYYAEFYRERIIWEEWDGTFSVFAFIISERVYRLLIVSGEDTVQIDFVLLERW